ncbi:MAG: M20/M25/M40 family metallo-hydrolase, partial [Bacteroidales bacterium]
HVLREPKTKVELAKMIGALKGAWVLINGENKGWPIDYTATGDSLRAIIIAENEKIEKQNDEIREYNWSIEDDKTKTPKELIPLKEEPALFYKEMRNAGILGIIQSAKVPITALYDRKNIEKMTFETLPTVPDIKLDEEQFKVIAKMVDRREYFQLEFDIRNHFKMGPVKYHNIIGVIKGTEFPNEYVLTGGHLDAFDVATGGVDCGSGITPNMEAARLIAMAGGKPKRTIMFCLWAGEEYGLWGSKYFVEHGSEMLPNIVNYFNRDGGPTVPNGITVTPAMYDDFVKVCEPVNSINKDFPFEVRKRTTEPKPIPTSAGGSDHAHFMMSGVPTIGFSTGDPKGYNFSYGEIWHTERDTYNKSIPEYQEQTAVVTAVVVYGLANLDHMLSRENLFKAPESANVPAQKTKKRK